MCGITVSPPPVSPALGTCLTNGSGELLVKQESRYPPPPTHPSIHLGFLWRIDRLCAVALLALRVGQRGVATKPSAGMSP